MPATIRAELPRQLRPRLRELLVAQNLARDGLALDPLHDEAGAEFVLAAVSTCSTFGDGRPASYASCISTASASSPAARDGAAP